MISKMTTEFTSRIEYNILTPRYPLPRAQWNAMGFSEKLDAKLLGGTLVREAIRKFRPDIIYSDNPLYVSQYRLTHILSRKIPVVLHLRGDLWREHLAAFGCSTLRTRLLFLQEYSFDWSAVTFCSEVTPICRWLEQIVRHYVPGKRTEVVYQGVDAQQFKPMAGFEAVAPAVAIIQNHSILPKVQGLLNFKRIIQKLPGVNFYIAEGEAWAQQFLSLVKSQYDGIPNVHFVSGMTSSQMVSKMVTACDCYVLASGLDCCPTTVLEASLLKKPVLASRVGGVPEIVEDGYTGWTIDNENLSGWVNKIQMLTEDARLCKRLGRQGKEWVTRRFGWPAIAKQVEHLLVREVERNS